MKPIRVTLLIMFLLRLGSCEVFGQTNIIDSLKRELKHAKHDTTRAEIYLTWGEQIYLQQPDSAVVLWKKANGIAEFNLKNLSTSKSVQRVFKLQTAESLDNIAFIYDNQGAIPKALEFFGKSLKIREEIGDKKGIATILNNLGFIYYNQGEIPKALEYFGKSLKIKEEIGYKDGIAYSLINIGAIYHTQGDIPKALEYYGKSLKIYKEIGDKKGIANSLNNIGFMYDNQGELPKALESYSKSLKIHEEIGDKYGIAYSLNSLGFFYLKQKKYQKALEFCLKSMNVSKELGFPEIISDAAKGLHQIYKATGNYKLAMENYELYIQMRDSINNESTRKASIKQQLKREYETKAIADSVAHAKETEVNNAELAKRQAEIKTKKNQQYMLFGGLGLVLIFAGFMYNRFKITQKQKGIIEEQKEIVDEKNKEITDSITYAKRIQSAILPSQKIVKEYLPESFILYKPKDIVAGDFYWLEHSGNNILFAACDCTGHGVPGAMVSVVCNNGLNRAVREFGLTDPGKILDKTREIVIQEFEKSEEEVKDGMDVSLVAFSDHKIKWAGANNPLWLLRNGELIEYKADKQPIGKYSNPTPFSTHEIELQDGDTIYIFTDGFADQFGGEKGKKYKSSRFKELLLSTQDKNMSEQRNIINETFETWKVDLEQNDDVCVIGVKI